MTRCEAAPTHDLPSFVSLDRMTKMIVAPTDVIDVTPANRDQHLAGTPVFFRLAANMAARLRYGALIFLLPDGRKLKFSGALEQDEAGVIEVRDYSFARRSVLGGGVG
ncbi:MAG TPA: hypothetical protein DDZ68_09080, partial [Parvularcula sp.]|nr:hypothetical protein [Parvularcula sp.]